MLFEYHSNFYENKVALNPIHLNVTFRLTELFNPMNNFKHKSIDTNSKPHSHQQVHLNNPF